MTFEQYRLLVPQYLAGELSVEQRSVFEQQLSTNLELQRELEELRSLWDGLSAFPEEQPSPALRARFYQRFNALDRPQGSTAPKSAWWRLSPFAQFALAAAVFLLGLAVGRINLSESGRAAETAEMRSEVQSLREMIALSLLERQSVTSRLEGVSWSSRVDRPDTQLTTALVSALNHDPNVNVRLSSIDALSRLAGDAGVRNALVESLPQQQSPLVQIALIDTLVQIRAQSAGEALTNLARNPETNGDVRQRAQWALENLGFQ
jgi:hypothetical protein